MAQRVPKHSHALPVYQPLQRKEIRPLTLVPGKQDDRLECYLKIVFLDNNPEYEALSYVWGDPQIKKAIYLQDREFQVARNLEAALRHLRHEGSERIMWIDALCTNQSDDVERAEQVKQMQVIYARTSHLVIWAGEAEGDSDLGMQTMKQIGYELKDVSYGKVDLVTVSLIKDVPDGIVPFDPKPWVAVNRVLRREWFQRVWVVQEVCMPHTDMSFVCGYQSVPWEYVSRVSNAIQRYDWGGGRIMALVEAGYYFINLDTPVNLVREIWKSQVEVLEGHSTLIMHLWNFRSRKCGDPRDKVFAILGICKDLSTGDSNVDYSAPVGRVYSEVAKFLIERDRSLTLMSACQSYGKEIPNWEKAAETYSMPQEVALPKRKYRMISKNCELKALFARISALGTHIGNDADTTGTHESQKRMFSLFHEWWPLAKTQTPDISASGERRFDAFWRTITTDMNSFSQKPRQQEEGNQFRLWMISSDPSAFEPGDLSIPDGVKEIVKFIASFQQATANRRFFVTEEGSMGLGPRLTEPGDLLCVLVGSQVPFILRQVKDHYVLVGECYCHGIMEGEAVQGLEDGKVDLPYLTLR